MTSPPHADPMATAAVTIAPASGLSSRTGWDVVESAFRPDLTVPSGSNFLVGNGYLGYRGTFEEDRQDGFVACVVSDTYDMADGKWQELCNAPNGLFTSLSIEGELVSPASGTVDDFERRLDLRHALFSRRLTWRSGGPAATISSERFASLSDIHLLAMRYTVTLDRAADLDLSTGIDGRVWSLNGDHFSDCRAEQVGDRLVMTATMRESGRNLVVAEALIAPALAGLPVSEGDRQIVRSGSVPVPAGDALELVKLVAIYSGNDVADPRAAALAGLDRALAAGYDRLKADHAAAWDAQWADTDVRIDGDPVAQVALRFCLYHNIIATPAHSDHLPVGARGLSCQAYQGAAFWDQEIFNLPAFLFTRPAVARALLTFRHKTLDGARGKARRLGYRGAFYAWVSGASGEELCPDFFFKDVLSGRPIRNHFNVWQIHVSPDIVYAIRQYWRATGDWDFIVEFGAEIVFEVARFLVSHAYFKEDKNRYELIRLLGPDEYHENVDNNAFTNHMAAFALHTAAAIHERLATENAERLAALAKSIDLDADEPSTWTRVGDRMYLPEPDPETRLIPQFDGFFGLADRRPDEVRQDLKDPGEYWGWPNGVAVHTQVSKQADVVQLFCLHDVFDDAVVRANYDYYEPRCQHGSSLSYSAHALVAARIGHADQAYDYFLRTARVDLENTAKAVSGGTFIGGIHTAACAGAWQVAVFGFGGVRLVDGALAIDPRLPERWSALSFPIAYRGGHMTVTATRDGVTVTADPNNPAPLPLRVAGVPVDLAPGEAFGPQSARSTS